jgi:carbamoyltransferase
MIILGVNSVFHESSAAVVVNGRVVASAQEERFNRRKHAKPADVDNAHILPVEAIKFCVEQARISAGDIDSIAYSYDPALRRQTFVPDPFCVEGDWGGVTGEKTFWDSLDRVPEALRTLLGSSAPIEWVRHHLAHAASVYYPFCPRDAARQHQPRPSSFTGRAVGLAARGFRSFRGRFVGWIVGVSMRTGCVVQGAVGSLDWC